MSTPDKSEPVATGDRRDEVRFEPDPDQLVRIRATFKPDAPYPAEEQSAATDSGAIDDQPSVQDVAASNAPESVWDARPVEDDEATPKA